jgi:hypothetical protein
LKGIASLLKAVARTEWNISDLKDWSGQSLISEPKFVTVEYKRGDDEVSLFQSLISLIQQLNPTSAAQSLKAILLKQAASSPLTLERSVRQLRNNLAHSKSEIFVASEIRRAMEDGTEEPAADSILPSMSTGIWRNRSNALRGLNNLIEQMDSLATDKKLEALEGLVLNLRTDNLSKKLYACVFCASALPQITSNRCLRNEKSRLGYLREAKHRKN